MHDGIRYLAMANNHGLQHGLGDVFRGLITYVYQVRRAHDSLLVASAQYNAAFTPQSMHSTTSGYINHVNLKLCSSFRSFAHNCIKGSMRLRHRCTAMAGVVRCPTQTNPMKQGVFQALLLAIHLQMFPILIHRIGPYTLSQQSARARMHEWLLL